MSLEYEAGRLQTCGLSLREILVGSLLAMDEALRLLREDDVEIMARLVAEMCVAMNDNTTPTAELAYGVPLWLIGTIDRPERSRGLGAFLWSVYNGGGKWKALFQKIIPYIDDLQTLHALLSKGPYPTPRERYEQLRTLAAIGNDGKIRYPRLRASASRRERSEQTAVAELATRDQDPVLADLGGRLGGMDFVVVGGTSESVGLVLAATVKLASEQEPRDVRVQTPRVESIREILGARGWSPANESFWEGLERAREAVTQLLRVNRARAELLSQLNGVTVEIRGVLPIAQVSDKSAGLPLALNMLSQLTNLALPAVLPTGVFNDDLTLEAMEPSMVEAKARAAVEDGLNESLLVYAPEMSAREGVATIPGNTLNEACEAVWGEPWKAWVERTRSKALEEMDLMEGWQNGALDGAFLIGTEPVEIEAELSKRIATSLRESQMPLVSVLGGKAQSGKTWIAQQVERKLQAEGWAVAVLRPLRGGFPDSESLERYLSSYTERRNRQKALLILDEMVADELEEDFINELQRLRTRFNISVLAVMRLDTGCDVDFENVTAYKAFIDEEELKEFATQLVQKYDAFRNAEACIGTAIASSGGNLWLLIRLLHFAVTMSKDGGYQRLLDQYYQAALGGCNPAQVNMAKRLASLSRVSIPVPEWFLQPLPADRGFLRSLSASKDAGGNWRFPVPVACEAIIGFSPQPIAGDRLELIRNRIVFQLKAYFLRCIQEGRDDEAIDSLSRLRRGNAEILSSTFAEFRSELMQWARVRTNPIEVSKVFRAIQEDVNETERKQLAGHLLTLFCAELPALTIPQVARMLMLLRDHHIVLEASDEENNLWRKMLDSLKKTVPQILAGHGSRPRARLSLVRSLWRLHEADADELIVDNIDALLSSQGNFPAEEYLLALELLAMSDRIQGYRKTRDLFESSANLAKLASETPERKAGFLAHLCQLMVRLRSSGEKWGDVLDQGDSTLREELSRAGVWEVAEALKALARYDRAFGVRLLSVLQPNDIIRRILQGAAVGEGARMLRMLAQLHLTAAWNVLYSNNEPSIGLAQKIARLVKRDLDPRGAGMMLKTCAIVDSSFGMIHDGFAKVLCDSIGMSFFEAQFHGDRRTSVLFHLLEGLMEAQARFSPDIQDSAIKAIARAINSGNLRDWAPRLALLALGHPDLHARFAERLREQIPASKLLRGLRGTRSLEALACFHQLSAVLYPSQTADFTEDDCHLAFAALYRSDRPEVVTRAARSIALTLRRGGDAQPGQTAIRLLSRNWKYELEHAATPGDCATTIRNLTALDIAVARDAVVKAKKELRKTAERGLRQEPQLGIELLDAIEQAAPGEGRDLVRDFQSNHRLVWDRLLEDIAYEQEPRSQGSTFHRLTQIGGFPSLHLQNRVLGIWKDRFKTIASPAAIVSLLRTFEAWNPDSIYEWSGRINSEKLLRRLSGHAITDLEWTEALLAAMNYGDMTQLRDRIIAIVDDVEDLPARIGLSRATRLMAFLHPIDHKAGLRLLDKSLVTLNERINDPMVADEAEFLAILGTLAKVCRLYGRTLSIPEQPLWWKLFPTPPVASLWAVCWLEDCGWTAELMNRSFEQLDISALQLRPPALCTALITAAERNRLDTIQNSLEQWPIVTNVSLYVLEGLIEQGISSPELGELLQQHEGDIRAKVSEPSHRLHPARGRIEESFKRMFIH
jgi:hypothetical protein